MVRPAARGDRRLLELAQARRRLARVEDPRPRSPRPPPRTARSASRCPDRRPRKFSAVRSAVRIPAAGPSSRATTSFAGSSFTSKRAKTAAATSRPGDHPGLPLLDVRRRPRIRRNQDARGQVAVADVLGERAVDQLVHARRVASPPCARFRRARRQFDPCPFGCRHGNAVTPLGLAGEQARPVLEHVIGASRPAVASTGHRPQRTAPCRESPAKRGARVTQDRARLGENRREPPLPVRQRRVRQSEHTLVNRRPRPARRAPLDLAPRPAPRDELPSGNHIGLCRIQRPQVNVHLTYHIGGSRGRSPPWGVAVDSSLAVVAYVPPKRGRSCSTRSRTRSTSSAPRWRRSARRTSSSTSGPRTRSRSSCSARCRWPTARRSARTPGFAQRFGLRARSFEPAVRGVPSTGVKGVRRGRRRRSRAGRRRPGRAAGLDDAGRGRRRRAARRSRGRPRAARPTCAPARTTSPHLRPLAVSTAPTGTTSRAAPCTRRAPSRSSA